MKLAKMKNTSEDSPSGDTDSDRGLVLESGAEEYEVPSATARTLPTWYRRLMTAFRADLNACRHVDLARLVHRNIRALE